MRRHFFAMLALSVIVPCQSLAAERIADRVYLVRDKPGSATRFQMVVNAGCLDEEGEQCRGLAHYLEHVLLVGRNAEHKDMAVRMFGDGMANGWTHMRGTVYVHATPARPEGPHADLERLFAFYAARLKDFAITDEDAARERNVVLQEHDWRVQSNPYRLAFRDLQRKALPDHPSGQWTIGTRSDIQAFTIDGLRAYHRNWYHINNVHFVVSGDIEPASLKEIADKALSDLKPATLPERNFSRRPDISGPAREDFSVKGPQFRSQGAQVIKIARMDEPDRTKNRAARIILQNFLASELPGSPKTTLGASGRIEGEGINLWLERAAPETVLLAVGANAGAGTRPEETRDAVVEYLETLGRADVLTDEIVERIKARLLRTLADSDKNPSREFNRLVNWLANRNTYEELLQWPDVIRSVRPEEVRALARSIAGPGRLVTQTVETAERAP